MFKAEQPLRSDLPKESSEDALTRRWYNNTSWEGRSLREFEKLRKETREARSLDFDLYFHDKDYERLINENALMQQLVFDEETVSLMALWDKRTEAGLSAEQFEKLSSAFSPEAVKQFKKNMTLEDGLQHMYTSMSPEDLEKDDAVITNQIRQRIERNMKRGRV